MTKVYFVVDSIYPAFFTMTREEATEAGMDFDKGAIEVTDEEFQVIQNYWKIYEQYCDLCKKKLK